MPLARKEALQNAGVVVAEVEGGPDLGKSYAAKLKAHLCDGALRPRMHPAAVEECKLAGCVESFAAPLPEALLREQGPSGRGGLP